MLKSIEEINEKISKGKAVVLTAEEIIEFTKQKGPKKASAEVDVVTTGTFAPMCSSGAYFNLGHTRPRIKLGGGRITLNEVPAYTGLAAVDIFLGATAISDADPKNSIHPGRFAYGGGHVIEDLVAGKDIKLSASTYGTDCYPRQKLDSWIKLADVNEAVLLNIRNCYQNYNVAVNLSASAIYTYMGILQPGMRNATYCSAGQLSPLLNDPLYRTIGLGTRIFLGGGIGWVVGPGTQHNPGVPRSEDGVPRCGAGTLSVTGNLKQMDPRWIRGASFVGYGTTLAVGIGVPIPILDEDILEKTCVADSDIKAQVVDYSKDYPENEGAPSIAEVSYAELKSGIIAVNGENIPTSGLSSYIRAREIASILKKWIQDGLFFLSRPCETLPSANSGIRLKPFSERPIERSSSALTLNSRG